jgi:thiol-disulfide isomerase/thioredoxin
MTITRRQAALAALSALAAPVALAQAVPPGAPGDPRPKAYKLIDQPAPGFELPSLTGETVRLSDYRGKALILYWWGLWCPDCVADSANVAALAAETAKDKRLAFLAIHTRGRFGRWPSIPDYFKEKGYNYPTAVYGGREFPRDAYKIEWYPTFLGIDPNGVIRTWRTDLGATGGAEFLAKVKALAA